MEGSSSHTLLVGWHRVLPVLQRLNIKKEGVVRTDIKQMRCGATSVNDLISSLNGFLDLVVMRLIHCATLAISSLHGL